MANEKEAVVDFSAFTEAGPDTGDALGKISDLVYKMVDLDTDIAKAELALKKLVGDRADLAENQIPELMESVHQEELTVRGGLKVKLKKVTYTSVSKDRKPLAIKWLDDNNHGGIVKRTVVVSFNKCDEEKVAKLIRLIGKGWPDHKTVLDVNGSTVKALITKLMEDGEDVPKETFGVHQVTAATLVK